MDRYRQTDNADRPSFTGLAALSFPALGLLIVIKLVAEQNLLPDGDIFRVIIATWLPPRRDLCPRDHPAALLPPRRGRGRHGHPTRARLNRSPRPIDPHSRVKLRGKHPPVRCSVHLGG